MSQLKRTLQETTTSHNPAAVLQAAKNFFGRQTGIYAAFPEQESKNNVTMRGQGGEEVVVSAAVDGAASRVRASTLFFDQAVDRFLSTLPLASPVEVA